MGKKSIITGAIVLTCANLATRFIGFFYRIYMVNAIGTEGIGLYQLIMPIYMLAWSISSSGFTTTISKLSAQEKAKGQYGNMRRILHQSAFICMFISLFIGLILFVFANYISSSILNEPRTLISLQILCLAFPFMSVGSCIRGYFFGIQDSVVPAFSQVLEQFVRICTVYIIGSFLIPYGIEYACAAATCGIVMGEVISFAYVFIAYKNQKRFIIKKSPALSSIETLKMVLCMAVPLTSARVISSMLSTIENILIPQRLALFNSAGDSALSVYGQLTGMAMPLIQFPTAVLVAISVTLVPALSETQAMNRTKETNKIVEKSIKFAVILGLGFTMIFSSFPYEICEIIYSQKELGSLLLKLCLICPFLYMQITLNGLLNGLGSHKFIFKQNIISSVINLFFIYFLMPKYGTNAFIIGMTLSLIITTSIGYREIIDKSCAKISIFKILILPILCCLTTFIITNSITSHLTLTTTTTLLSMFLLGLLYLLLLLLTKTLSKEEIFAILPKK